MVPNSLIGEIGGVSDLFTIFGFFMLIVLYTKFCSFSYEVPDLGTILVGWGLNSLYGTI